MNDGSLEAYYSVRAPVYEAIYEKPERQADLTVLKQLVPSLLAGRDVLEVACGTGYWTQVIGSFADNPVFRELEYYWCLSYGLV